MDFLRWKSRADEDGFPDNWTPQQLEKIRDLLIPMHRAWSLAVHKISLNEASA
jgi:hypothetical protein